MISLQQLYKRDTTGKIRIWFMELDGNKYRTVAGVEGGSLVTSEWTVAKPTNVGRSNERNAEEQAEFEVKAAYKHRLERDYFTSVNEVDTPRIFKPMLAKSYEAKRLLGQRDIFVQPKLDGFRCIANAKGLWTREGKRFESCAHIERALKPLFERYPDLILDGELYNHDYSDRFGDLSSMLRKSYDGLVKASKKNPNVFNDIEDVVQYHVYDCPSVDGTFKERDAYLGGIIFGLQDDMASSGVPCPIKVVNTTTIHTPDFDTVEDIEKYIKNIHDSYASDGYEGAIVRLNGPYEIGKRSTNLLKMKVFDDAEFDIVRIDEGDGNWTGCAKRIWFWLPNADRTKEPDFETETNVFKAGTRGSMERQREIFENRDKYKQATVRFFGWTDTANPKPRHGVVTKYFEGERDL